MILKDKIPEIYQKFFGDILDLEIPRERFADCGNCNLCFAGDKSPYINTKCCSYFPSLPNYMLGGILSDPELTEGASRIRSLIDKKKGVSPYGIIPTMKYSNRRHKLFSQSVWSVSKEENEKLLCPYYNNGKCSVWKFRENLCVTYFCRHAAGKKGDQFWTEVNTLLNMSEQKLAKFSLIKMGWPLTGLMPIRWDSKSLGLEDSEDDLVTEQYDRIWNEWKGREEELYIRCYEMVRDMDNREFEGIMGIDKKISIERVKRAQSKLSASLIPEVMLLQEDAEFRKIDKRTTEVTTNQGKVIIPSLHVNFIHLFRNKYEVSKVYKMASELMIFIEPTVESLLKIGALKEA